MTKDEAIIEFLKGLRIVLNNAFAYSKDHPYFIKSVEAFKEKVNTLFGFLNPISVRFTTQSLFLDARYWDKEALFTELAASFHIRKIKGIEFRKGITIDELVFLLSRLALSTKEVLKLGGLRNILENEHCQHLSIEELDYSDLLQEEGEESKDIWVYLFGQTVKSADQAKVITFASHFSKFTKKIRTKDLAEDETLHQNLIGFLDLLKNRKKDTFDSCAKDLIGFFIRDTQPHPPGAFTKLKEFLANLNKAYVAEALWDEIVKNENFDQGNLSVFFSLFDKDSHAEIAPLLGKKIKESPLLQNNPNILKRLKGLFSTPEDSFVLGLYRHALIALFEQSSPVTSFSFDQDHLAQNYRILLLSLLSIEEDSEKLKPIASSLIQAPKDLAFLQLLLEAIDEKLKKNASLKTVLEPLTKDIADFIEHNAFEVKDARGLAGLTAKLKKSSLGLDFYLKKIFEERRINPVVLQLLCRFFSQQLAVVYERLQEKRSDIEFMIEFVRNTKYIEPSLRQEVLKKIFAFSNNLVRLEALKLMRAFSQPDEQFLLSVLEGGDFSLKKEALLSLSADIHALELALPQLLAIPSPLGWYNARILESIALIEEARIKEAKGFLILLTSRKFFWNRKVREKAHEALAKLT